MNISTREDNFKCPPFICFTIFFQDNFKNVALIRIAKHIHKKMALQNT